MRTAVAIVCLKPLFSALHDDGAVHMPAMKGNCVPPLLCLQPVFNALDVEVELVLTDLAEGTARSVKTLAGPSAGGMTILRWGLPLSEPAKVNFY